MPITKASGNAVAPAAKGDLVVGSATNDASVLSVGSNGQVLTVDSATTTGVKWATVNQPLTWTPRIGSQSGYVFSSIAYNGSNLFVAAGTQGTLLTSPDGITWTSRTSGFGSQNIYAVAFGNGLFVAVGSNGVLTTSSDGITWTARTANMGTNGIFAVTYANSLWVAVGGGGGTTNTGGITYSSDGITWTRKSQSITVAARYNDVVWNGTNWIVAAQIQTNNYLYASTPSGTWTAGHTGTSGDIYKIIWDGTRHITNETNGGQFRYSTSTTLGTTTAYSTTHRATLENPGGIVLYNGKIYSTTTMYLGLFTPATSTSVLTETPSILPQQMGSAGTLDGSSGGLWVGSLGLIYANSSGIYTTF